MNPRSVLRAVVSLLLSCTSLTPALASPATASTPAAPAELVHPTKQPATGFTPPIIAAGGRVFASSLVRAGNAWALAYYRARNSVDSDLYLVRFDDEARVLSDTHLGPGIPASLAWSGDTLGIAYSAYENGDYVAYFARADGHGALIEGSRVRLTQVPCYAPRLVWNSKRQEWGVAWHDTRDPQPRVRLTRIAGSGVVLGTYDVATMAIGSTPALISVQGRYHFLLSTPLQWLEHDGERVVASAELGARGYEPALVEDHGGLLASWVEGSKAMLARLEGGQLRSKKPLYDAGAGRHIQGLIVTPRASDLMLFWGEHTSAVYNTAIYSARVDGKGTATPAALDPTPEPQGFPFVATTPERLMLVYQLGDYNGAPRLLARRIDEAPAGENVGTSHALLERIMAEQKPSVGEMLRNPAPMGRLPLGAFLPCSDRRLCPEIDKPAPAPQVDNKIRVNGALTERDVSKIIAAARQKLSSCFPAQARATGRLVLGFTIDARGLVTNVHVRQTTMQDQKVTSCISAAMARLRFPASSGSTNVKLPIEG